ncbi:efflux RND transporter periplasmic adaptor subunit [Fodinisporobacter ferrooxydans]|uniref:Efflux RND transporter periplasmic adaptor subunit n=1 Tax=Fodinisporobacter ferrooxydans TaxID=2901836 RepID=A0ABY4CDS2_9BACL|nr:efflux RND transporter periplasmic adaptor subunit [Alicyclobacillaceae bacterium MYW30-H2]
MAEISSKEIEPNFANGSIVRRKKKWIAIGLAGLLVAGSAFGIYEKVASPKNTMANMRLVTVQRGDVTETVSASGTIQAATQVNLNFSAGTGKLTALNVKVGDKVKAGQVLATLDNRTQQAQVASAQANLSAAQAQLAKASEGSTAQAIAQQKANLEAAQARLAQAKEGATPQALAVQETSVEKAKAALDGAKTAYQDQLAIYNDRSADQQTLTSAQNQVDQATTQLKNAQAALDSANAKLTQAKEGPTASQLYAAQEAVNAARSQLSNAQQQLGLGGSSSQYLSNMNAISQAEASLANAENNLATLQAGTDANVIVQDQATVTQAQATVQQEQSNLKAAQQAYSTAVQSYNDRTSAKAQLDQSKNNLDQAQSSYDQAVAQMNQLQAPPDSNAVKEAQAAVDQAQAQLDQTMASPDAATIQQAQAAVDQAQAQLQQQQKALDNFVLKAPIDGVVTQVNGHPGEMTNAASSSSTSAIGPGLIVLDDSNSTDLQVMAQVSQTDIGKIKSGMNATFSTSTFQNKSFNGKVLLVYPEATTSNGVTTYDVLLSVDNREGLLKPGMTANVTIQVGDHKNVLYVPSMALKEVNGQDGVLVQANGSTGKSGSQAANPGAGQSGKSGSKSNAASTSGTHFQSVQIGYYSSNKVEILSGLKEGDQVVVTFQNTGSSNNKGFAGRGPGFGGGPGGFGGGRGN